MAGPSEPWILAQGMTLLEALVQWALLLQLPSAGPGRLSFAIVLSCAALPAVYILQTAWSSLFRPIKGKAVHAASTGSLLRECCPGSGWLVHKAFGGPSTPTTVFLG